MQAVQVPSLSSHMSQGQKPKNVKQKQYCNKFNKDFKVVHIKNNKNLTMVHLPSLDVPSLAKYQHRVTKVFFLCSTLLVTNNILKYRSLSHYQH